MRRTILAATALLIAACLGDADLPPAAPTLFPVSSPTTIAHQVVSGTKEADTAVLNGDLVIVPIDNLETWSFDLPLAVGDNELRLRARSRTNKLSRKTTRATIRYDLPCPPPPSLDPITTPTGAAQQTLSGNKAADTAVRLNRLDAAGTLQTSDEIWPLDAGTTWTYDLALSGSDGPRYLALVATDDESKTSEPVTFVIERDTTAPTVVDRYPASSAIDVPTDHLIVVSLDEAIGVDPISPPADLLTVRNQSSALLVAGGVVYNPHSHSLVFNSGGALPASTSFTVTLTAARFSDLGGNAMAADVVWTFTTGTAAGAAAPAAPAVTGGASSPTAAKRTTLTGTKDALSSVWLNGLEVVPVSASTGWSATWDLAVGANALVVSSKGANGMASLDSTVNIERSVARPAAPAVIDPPASVETASVTLSGTKPADTAILLFGEVAVCRTADTTWSVSVPLVPGPNAIEVRTRDAALQLSEAVWVRVDYLQPYAGRVPANFQLYVGLNLRDLRQTLPISTSFETGANRYGLDVWVEGPLSAGETCSFNDGAFERRNTRLAATLSHYKGTKAGHENPFADADYRSPDFLAALIEAGALSPVGLSQATDRRDGQGRQATALGSALTLAAVDAIDETCSGRSSVAIDGCTEATVTSGLHELRWIPLDPASTRLLQGDYLLQIAIHLDRDPGWVAATDTETCWEDSRFSDRGGHRLVRRISLGGAPWSLPIGLATEQAGPDSEPAASDGQLRYLAPNGIILRWGPP